MQAHWQQVRVFSEYLDMDRTIRRALSGAPVQWPANIEAEWCEFNLGNARLFDEEFDIVVVHHTASVGLLGALNNLRQHGNDVGDVIVLTEMDRVGNVELSALRDNATVLIHQGMPRGISIEFLEEMWQARTIVSGRSPVAEAVLSRPRVGVLAGTAPEQAHAIVRLLNRPAGAARIGAAAKARGRLTPLAHTPRSGVPEAVPASLPKACKAC